MNQATLPDGSPRDIGDVEREAGRNGRPRVRVLLADDQPQVRSALRLLLELAQPRWLVVGEAEDAAALERELSCSTSDIVLLDWELPGLTNGLRQSLLENPRRQAAFVVLSSSPETRPRALEAGADAFVSKVDHPEELLRTLKRSLARRKARRRSTD